MAHLDAVGVGFFVRAWSTVGPGSGHRPACVAKVGPYEQSVEPFPAGPQVKSLTFVTLRHVLFSSFVGERGEDVLAAVWNGLNLEARTALQSAEPGGWIDEHLMANVMDTILHTGFEGDPAAYQDFARRLAAAGISRFLKIFLSLTSARFALRRVPVVWNHLRRNAGEVTVGREEGGLRLRYVGFPFFAREAYRLLSVANCEALAQAASGQAPCARVESWSADTLELYFELKAA